MALPYYPMYQNPYSFYPAAYPSGYSQQTVQQTVPNASQPIAQTSMIWVSGEREAQMYPVAPNNAVTLWSQTESVVYVKQADATGKPTIKVYDLVERADSSSLSEKENGKSEEFASKADLEAIKGAMGEIVAKLAPITADIESMKGDLYGLSGKKKAVKKQEVDEDD